MRLLALLAVAAFMIAPNGALADDVTDAIEKGRKAYAAGDLAGAKQALDLASQLIGQKNAEIFGKLLPAALAGWTAEPVQTVAVSNVGFGASTASRTYRKRSGDEIEVQITGDSAMIVQYATFLANPQIAGAMGKIVMIGNLRALQNNEGDIHMVVANKFLVAVQGNGSTADKLAYARAVNIAQLSRM